MINLHIANKPPPNPSNMLKKLEDAIQNESLVIFAGSGVSARIGMPTWQELVEKILIKLEPSDPKLKSLIEPLKNKLFSPIDILAKIENYKTDILEVLVDNLSIAPDTDLTFHKSLLDISEKIITTNYDIAFEKANENITKIPYKSNFRVAKLSETNSYIFKIHGCIESPDDCILFKSQYDSHYDNLSSSTFELGKIFSEKTILFIGFSLSDPYLNRLFELIRSIYKGYSNSHFLITSDKSFKVEFITPIHVDDYQDSLIQQLEVLRGFRRPKSNSQKPKTSHPPSVHVLSPRPIDKPDINFNTEKIFEAIKGFNLSVTFDFLQQEKLRNIDDCAYLMIFTSIIKNQILIEDEFLKSKLIQVSELEELIGGTVKSVFIFYQGENPVIEIKDLKTPLVFIKMPDDKIKDIVSSFAYKAFKKADLQHLLNDSFYSTNLNIKLVEVEKGIAERIIYKPNISRFIDKKNVAKFIGRKTDIEFLIRKLVELKYDNKLLTIKGSGGIGKTTIITKAAIELADRGNFNQGIEFIPCHAISTFENFEFAVCQAFGFLNSKNLEDQLKNYQNKDKLIILDNFETLLYLTDKSEFLRMLAIMCDSACVVTTSRQLLDLEYEEIYELRNFTTDEGVELFKSIYPIKDSEDLKILRQDIVEKLLNNNPLAIKLVAKGLPHNKSMEALKSELDVDLFGDIKLETIFERPEDLNIEKSNSLYHSINYSYQKLNRQEKLAFDVLSLFPDGIGLENFKLFVKASKKMSIPIGDKEIKSLDDKSLLENSNAFLKLQSIISRFSDYQFKNHDADLKRDLYTTALSYNHFFVDFLTNRNRFRLTNSLMLLDSNTNNYLKCIDFLKECNVSNFQKMEFIEDVSFLFRSTNQPHQFINLVRKFGDNSQEQLNEKEKLFLKVVDLKMTYWTIEFDQSFNELKSLLPLSELSKLDIKNNVDELIFNQIAPIYTCEGYCLDILKYYIQHEVTNSYLNHIIFQLGYLKEVYELAKIDPDPTFFEFEIAYANDSLSVTDAKKYLSQIYKKENIEIVQMIYLLTKAGVSTESYRSKIVISNPFTEGMSFLIKALDDKAIIERESYFIRALDKLYHIKYYYTEALLQYSKFLKETGNAEFDEVFERGRSLCIKFSFRYLLFKFDLLVKDINVYEANEYSIDLIYEQFDEFLKSHIQTVKKERKLISSKK